MTPYLATLKPEGFPTIMSLIAQAGLDVSDWDNRSDNPKYCYNWAFYEEKVGAVLNLWFEEMSETKGSIIVNHNMRHAASKILAEKGKSSPRYRRAIDFDRIAKLLYQNQLPASVVICSRNKNSGVGKRGLDRKQWIVSNYNDGTGAFTVIRGSSIEHFVDQFSLDKLAGGLGKPVEKKTIQSTAYQRSALVREVVLARAKGRCECCGEPGFVTKAGQYYLETHRIQPLSEQGPDTVLNVSALCPNCHRKAHYSLDAETMRADFANRIHTKPHTTD